MRRTPRPSLRGKPRASLSAAFQAGLHYSLNRFPACHPPVELHWEKPEILRRVEDRVREEYDYPEIDWE